MPPMPMIGVFTACAAWKTARSAIGLIAGPLRPPMTLPSIGRRRRQSMAIPRQVLISEMASAPPEAAAIAIEAMLVTFGVSLAIIGVDDAPRQPATTRSHIRA